ALATRCTTLGRTLVTTATPLATRRGVGVAATASAGFRLFATLRDDALRALAGRLDLGERLDRAAADGPAASLARAAASGFLFLAQRRVEIGAGIARQLLAKLVAQHAALDLDR